MQQNINIKFLFTVKRVTVLFYFKFAFAMNFFFKTHFYCNIKWTSHWKTPKLIHYAFDVCGEFANTFIPVAR